MTSKPLESLYVWVWLPGRADPVVCGRLDREGSQVVFVYGQRYLSREDAIPLYLPDLPLEAGAILPRAGELPGPIADAGPDAWGRRVINQRLLGSSADDPRDLDHLTYLIESGSDRIGALDFQRSATDYLPRGGDPATLDELANATARFEAGESLSPALEAALLHGTSVGGARPKALMADGDRRFVAKFSSSDDTYPVVQGEFVAMRLAARAGLDVASVSLRRALGRQVLLVERFDRPGDGARRLMVSALAILGLEAFPGGLYASYADLASEIRLRFTDPVPTLHELFRRITFNILTGNNDDHARNHAAFWDGGRLTLTPAYDLCPSPGAMNQSRQAMAIGEDGWRASQVAGCIERAGIYRLTQSQAREIVDHQIAVIRDGFGEVCEEAGLVRAQRDWFWQRQFLHPFALEGY